MTVKMFTAATTLRGFIESLHQLGRILGEKALAVHDAHVGVATAVQDVGRVGHQQREAICCQQAQLVVIEQREELKKMRGGQALTHSQRWLEWVHEYENVIALLPCQSALSTEGGIEEAALSQPGDSNGFVAFGASYKTHAHKFLFLLFREAR